MGPNRRTSKSLNPPGNWRIDRPQPSLQLNTTSLGFSTSPDGPYRLDSGPLTSTGAEELMKPNVQNSTATEASSEPFFKH